MRPSMVTKAIKVSLRARQPMFLWGPPGVGKSDVVRQVSAELLMDMVDIRVILLDPVDLRGLPHVNGDNRAHWCPPAFLPHDPDSRGVLFLDELNAAPPSVQASAYQIVLDRKLGEYDLPEGWSVIAAGNRESDRAVAHRMPSALANRFVHIDFDVDNEDWYQWAAAHSVSPEVISFIRFKPSLLHSFDPRANNKAFPTPRSWEFVSNLISTGLDRGIEFDVISGAVGEGAASELIAFLRVYRDLPDPAEIVSSPKKAPIPNEISAVYALCGSLAAYSTAENLREIMTYARRLGKKKGAEFEVLILRDAYLRNKDEIGSTDAFLESGIENLGLTL